jgi:hypothetical protein
VPTSVRVVTGWAGAIALAFTASACSTNPPQSAQQDGSTTTTAGAHAPATTSTTGASSSTSTPTTAGHGAAGPTPTLGVASAWGASAIGFGQVKPGEISLGGDPTGVLTGITWQSWGGNTAVGTGTSTYVQPGQAAAEGVRVQATVEAFDLGTCGGAPAYTSVKWYFPGEGESLVTGANSTIDACSGP